MNYSHSPRFLFAGYTFEQEKEFKELRERMTKEISAKREAKRGVAC